MSSTATSLIVYHLLLRGPQVVQISEAKRHRVLYKSIGLRTATQFLNILAITQLHHARSSNRIEGQIQQEFH